MATNETLTGTDESAICLTGGFRAVNDTHPSYFNAISGESGRVASIDMVRIGLTVDGEALSEKLLAHSVGLEDGHWTGKVKPGSWHELFTFAVGDSSVTIGIGLTGKSCKIDMGKAFVEANPNKVTGDERFWKLMGFVSGCARAAELKRFDLAYDAPISRNSVRVTKDRRTYACYVSGGLTEYLGVRNTSGFTKVYDKAAELGIDGELTRIELTCAGDWDADELLTHWPQVHGWQVAESSRGWVRVMGMLLAERVEEGKEIESVISMLGRDSRAKVRESLRGSMIELPHEVAELAIAEAHAWESRVLSGRESLEEVA